MFEGSLSEFFLHFQLIRFAIDNATPNFENFLFFEKIKEISLSLFYHEP